MSVFPLTLPVKVLLLGSGELGKELTISLQRLGCPVVACDSYAGAPAMQVAPESRVLDMADATKLAALIAEVKPDLVVPEVEKLAPEPLVAAAAAGVRVAPSARVVQLTFDRQGIRRVAAEVAGVPTSPYAFADSYDSLVAGANTVGFPCFVKPTMSSSGHGQSCVTRPEELRGAWEVAFAGARAETGRVIVEGEIAFDYEITLLAVRHLDSTNPERVCTSFCAPIGHRQEAGDYAESWQSAAMPPAVLVKAQNIAQKVLDALAAETRQAPHESADAANPMLGLFGVELFVKGEEVFFSELSPRPHDTGMVTMITQAQNEFDLHVRAILGLPVDTRMRPGVAAGASVPIKADRDSSAPRYAGIARALAVANPHMDNAVAADTMDASDASAANPGAESRDFSPADIELRIFGKPEAHPGRRVGVALATGVDTNQARTVAREVASQIAVSGS